jgi:hypothetical protein
MLLHRSTIIHYRPRGIHINYDCIKYLLYLNPVVKGRGYTTDRSVDRTAFYYCSLPVLVFIPGAPHSYKGHAHK